MKKTKISGWRCILPSVMAFFTGRVRYIPEVDWRKGSWTHTAFRAYELIFGRAFGKNGVGDTIRAETVEYGYRDEEGRMVAVRRFYSLEALLSHAESKIRAFLKEGPNFGFEFVPIAQVITPGGAQFPAMPPIFSYAIAYVNTAGTRPAAGSSITVSHDASTSDLMLLFMTNWANSTDVFTGATFNSNAFARITGASGASLGGAKFDAAYYITGQTGTHNVVMSFSGSTDVWYVLMTYSGTDQTGSVIQTSSANLSGSSTTSQASAITATAATNAWAITYAHTAGETITGLSPSTRRNTTNDYFQGGDSNGVITASASYTPTWSAGASTQWFTSTVEIQPPQATTYNQNVIATTAVSASVVKQVPKTLVATSSVSGKVLKQMNKTLAATTAITAAIVKQMSKTLIATTAVSASVVAIRVFLQTLVATTTISASITKIPGKLLTATTAVSASVSKQLTLVRVLTATTAVSGVITKQMSKTLTAVSAVSGSITKIPGKILTATTAVSASITKQAGKLLTATTAISATIVAGRAVIMIATTAISASITKTPNKMLRAVIAITAIVRAPFWRTKYPSHEDGGDYEVKYPHD